MTPDHLSTEVRWMIGGILTILVLASAMSFVIRKRNPDRDNSETEQRIRTWWVIAALFGVSLVMSEVGLLYFFGFVSFLGLKEYYSLIPTRRADRRVLFWAYLSIPLQYYWVHQQWYGMFIIFIPVYLFLLIPTRMVIAGQTEGFLRSLGMVHWGLMTTVFSLSHAAYLLVLEPITTGRISPSWPASGANSSPGPGLLLLLVVSTELNDVAQFLWGKSFGKKKVAPSISPGKTWAGLVGGVVTTTLLTCVIGPWLTILDVPRSLLAGIVIGVSGFFGDLSISALKRDLGVKDSGHMLPGHGGILDRIDSLTYTAPLYFHFIYYCYF